MPRDFINYQFSEKPEKSKNDRRIYVSEDGNIRVEERHFRQIFSPEEFVALLTQIFKQNKKANQ